MDIPSIVYESLIPAFFLSMFELLFFVHKVRSDIDKGIFYMTRSLTDEMEKSYNEFLKSYDIPEDRMKAVMYQSLVLLSKIQESEQDKMNKNNEYRVKVAYTISIVLFVFILIAGSQANTEIFSWYLLINTVFVILAVGVFQYYFYTNFILKYTPSSQHELSLHMLEEMKLLFKSYSELNCGSIIP